MNRRHLLAAVALTGLFVAAGSIEFAGRASATNAAVSYAQTCDTATVTVTSQWDGGAIHVVITGPSPAIGFDVAPLASHVSTFRIIPNPLTVTLTSSNGHLLGDLTHTFTADGCGQPTTTTSSTLPGIVPGIPTTGATTSTPSTSPVTTVTQAPPSDATTVATTTPSTANAAATSIVHAVPTQLPTTGSGDAVPLVAIGAGIVVAGVLMLAVRRLARP